MVGIRSLTRKLPGSNLYREIRERSYLIKRPRLTPHGFNFSSLRKMNEGSFEKDVVEIIKHFHKTNSFRRFLDVGAHHGYFTCLATSLGMEVASFEPNPTNLRVLKRNLKANSYESVRIFPFALGEFRSKSIMYGFGTGFSIFESWAGDVSSKSSEIEFQRLDDLNIDCSNSIMKVDVEGAELGVIKGGADTFSRATNSLLMIEISGSQGNIDDTSKKVMSESETLQTLVNFGFSLLDVKVFDSSVEVKRLSKDELFCRMPFKVSTNLFFIKD